MRKGLSLVCRALHSAYFLYFPLSVRSFEGFTEKITTVSEIFNIKMSFFSTRLLAILLIFIAIYGECSDKMDVNTTSTEKPQKENVKWLFGPFTPLGLIITSMFVGLITLATVYACFVDFKGHSTQDFAQFESDPEELIQDWLENTQTPSKQQPNSERSADDTKVATVQEPMRTSDLLNDHNFLRKPEVSSRLHAEEKHARVIEAIYHASGRELPAQYKTGRNIHLTPAPTQPNSPNVSEMERTQVAATTVLSVINEVPTDPLTDATGASPLVTGKSRGISAKSVAKIVSATTEKQAELVRIQSETDVEIGKTKPAGATTKTDAKTDATSKSLVEETKAGCVVATPGLIPGTSSLEDLKKKETTPLMEVDRTPMPSDGEIEENESMKEDESKKNKK